MQQPAQSFSLRKVKFNTQLAGLVTTMTRNSVMRILVLLVVCSWQNPEGNCIPLNSLFSYGSSAGDSALAQQDDGYSPLVIFSESFPFYGMSSTLVFVSEIYLL